ncbi:MAG: sugar kinase [Deltaproteobacteria bacterium]|nr:sugar kinase [Deltaproteobacteria bacterium]
MTLLVVGSVAFDSVQTPFGKKERVLGGSANFFSMSASLLTRVQLVGVIGEDFPEDHVGYLQQRGVDTAGLTRVPGRTFHWRGRYEYDLNEAHTLETQLNVFADFRPNLPEAFRRPDHLFLANIDPELQALVLEQVTRPKLVALDTMNYWISGKRQALLKVLRDVDVLFVNDAEARQLSGEHNVVKAGAAIRKMGPRTVIIKRGEYGALMLEHGTAFYVPAYPLEDVFDPTGAGDTFAGGVMGALDRWGGFNTQTARQAMVVGGVLASFVVEDFSFDRLRTTSLEDVQRRYADLRQFTDFKDLPTAD